MLYLKSLKVNQRTINITFDGPDKDLCNLDRFEAVALSLLHGSYNSLRKYSKTNPIDLDRLGEFQSRYNDLITEMIGIMDIDVEEIVNF